MCELDGELDDALAELVSGGLLVEARSQPEPLYRFRHALIREATYHGLLRSQRRQLHARAAWHLEANAAERLAEVAAVLGHHFAAAGEDDRAVHYLELAGDHADRIFANEEAIALYRQALAIANGEHTGERGSADLSDLGASSDSGQAVREVGRLAPVHRPLRRSPVGRPRRARPCPDPKKGSRPQGCTTCSARSTSNRLISAPHWPPSRRLKS